MMFGVPFGTEQDGNIGMVYAQFADRELRKVVIPIFESFDDGVDNDQILFWVYAPYYPEYDRKEKVSPSFEAPIYAS